MIRFKKSAMGKLPYQVDPLRRLAAAKRHTAREKEKLGFLVDLIAVERAEDRVARLNAANVTGAKLYRHHRAQLWRRARRILRSLEEAQRTAIVAKWNAAPYPGDPEYLLNLLWASGINTQDPRWFER